MDKTQLNKLQKRLDVERKAKYGKIAICGKDEYCFFCENDSKTSCAEAYLEMQKAKEK